MTNPRTKKAETMDIIFEKSKNDVTHIAIPSGYHIGCIYEQTTGFLWGKTEYVVVFYIKTNDEKKPRGRFSTMEEAVASAEAYAHTIFEGGTK